MSTLQSKSNKPVERILLPRSISTQKIAELKGKTSSGFAVPPSPIKKVESLKFEEETKELDRPKHGERRRKVLEELVINERLYLNNLKAMKTVFLLSLHSSLFRTI